MLRLKKYSAKGFYLLPSVLAGINPCGGVGKVSHVFCALLMLQVIATGVSLPVDLAGWGAP